LLRIPYLQHYSTDDPNRAGADGGALADFDSNSVVLDCIFSGNGANEDGGAVYAWQTSLTLTGCTITGNTAGFEGAGVMNWDDGMSVVDSVSVSVDSSTFTNSAADGLDMDDTQSIRLVNVVSTGNGVSGFQVTAEEHFNIESLSIVGSEFSDNGLDGIWIKEEGTLVEQVSLSSVTATGNTGRGLNMEVSGTARLSAITSQDNGADDVLP
jgi:predicted outer membrane repeat protein